MFFACQQFFKKRLVKYFFKRNGPFQYFLIKRVFYIELFFYKQNKELAAYWQVLLHI